MLDRTPLCGGIIVLSVGNLWKTPVEISDKSTCLCGVVVASSIAGPVVTDIFCRSIACAPIDTCSARPGGSSPARCMLAGALPSCEQAGSFFGFLLGFSWVLRGFHEVSRMVFRPA